mmetsp:Transcript_14762/g.31535  ORF Transcript_14762/g.31535 Transcript_14762/m.31535 type:complete len:87 (-) Transcript_14762:68-328(-)
MQELWTNGSSKCFVGFVLLTRIELDSRRSTSGYQLMLKRGSTLVAFLTHSEFADRYDCQDSISPRFDLYQIVVSPPSSRRVTWLKP